MKAICLLLLNSVLFTTNAQNSHEILSMSNSLQDLWYDAKTEEAVETSIKVYTLSPSKFIDIVHTTLSQVLVDSTTSLNAHTYLDALYRKNIPGINDIIKPMHLFDKIKHDKDSVATQKSITDMLEVLIHKSQHQSRTELYGLLILQELAKNKDIAYHIKESILNQIIKNLEGNYSPSDISIDRTENERRAWARHLLAYSYNYRYKTFDKAEINLKNAAFYSPDFADMTVKHAYFYDSFLLNGSSENVNYKMDYYTYLVEIGDNEGALKLISEITFMDPTDNNIAILKSHFIGSSKLFKDYWHAYINTESIIAPTVKVEFENGQLDLGTKSNKWIFIDVWGTWCAPCIKELPAVQELFVRNSKIENSQLNIYTFSSGSKNLSEFLIRNKYTFPVAEVDKDILDSFAVERFPTKILISPSGRYLKIPSSADWKLYVKNYILEH